jgi:hypothetical protein
MGTATAAETLGVTPVRVRQLVAQGELPALRASGVLLLDADAVLRRAAADVRTGRPVSTARIWRMAVLIEQGRVAAPAAARHVDAHDGAPQARLLSDARRLAAEEVAQVAWRLRRRSAPALLLAAHPSTIERMLTDRRLLLTGPHAARAHGGDLVPDGPLDAYVDATDIADVVAHHALLEADGPADVRLRAVPSLTAMLGPEPRTDRRVRRMAPRLLVAVDLVEHGDARAASAGAALWSELRTELSDDGG